MKKDCHDLATGMVPNASARRCFTRGPRAREFSIVVSAANSTIVKCFISHSSEDVGEVRELVRQLSAADKGGALKFWFYEDDLEPGRDLDRLQNEIGQCDFFIVALSDRSMRSRWVQRELGLAHTLSKTPGRGRPVIIGICVVENPDPGKYIAPIRNFATAEKLGVYDFTKSRYWRLYRPDTDDVAALTRFMLPRVRFWGADIDDEDELFKLGVFDAYERLFPNRVERDDPSDILEWLKEERFGVSPNSRRGPDRRSPKQRVTKRLAGDWGSVFAVFEVAGQAVGLVYLTVHVRSRWVFGNYFGLLDSWRAHGRAKYFIETVKDRTEKVFGELKGVVFEVEKFTDRDLRRTQVALSSRRPKLLARDFHTIRAVMRVRLYQHYGALLLSDHALRRLQYRQPALNQPKKGERLTRDWLRRKEWDFWLMVWPLSLSKKRSFNLAEIIDFIYFDIFGSYADAREAIFSSHKQSFWRYLLQMRNEFLARNGRRGVGVRDLGGMEKAVWSLARKRELSITI
jgi:hypothetical protein